MKKRFCAVWCQSWPEYGEPQYGHKVFETIGPAKHYALREAEKSDYPDFAQVREESLGRYGWDSDTTWFYSDGRWLKEAVE